MSAKYYIIIRNNSEENQQYLIFNQLPQASENVGTAWANVWMKTGGTPSPNGTQNITIEVDNFAVCGTTPTALGRGVSVYETDWAAVTLKGQGVEGTAPVMDIVNGTPAFTQPWKSVPLPTRLALLPKPSILIANVYCGYGKYDDAGNVVPVAVWTARPSQTYEVTSKVTFYVSTGSYTAGQVVDITELGASSTIDFTTAKAGQTVATITHQKDGTYSAPVFSYPKTKLESYKN